MAEANSIVENLKAIVHEFDIQVEKDLQDIYNMGHDEPYARHGTEPPEEDEAAEEPQTEAGACAVETDVSEDTGDTGTDPDDVKPDMDERADSVGTDADVSEASEVCTDAPKPDDTKDVKAGARTAKSDTADDSARDDSTGDIEDKNWLFEENIRLREVERRLEEEKERLEAYSKELDQKAKEIESMNDKFIKDRAQFRDEMNLLTGQVTRERARLKQDEQFFDKKMEILKAGFADLDKAKRELESERMRREAQSAYYGDDDIPGYVAPVAKGLFVGITNPLMLKKRYKDLVKIYHPDNLAGDHDLFKAITIEYERLQSKIGSEGIG